MYFDNNTILFADPHTNKIHHHTGGNSPNKNKDVFYCPMRCEGDKTYSEPGDCPKCGMELKKVEATSTAYQCPMKCEGNKTYDKPGKRPKCGMELKKV